MPLKLQSSTLYFSILGEVRLPLSVDASLGTKDLALLIFLLARPGPHPRQALKDLLWTNSHQRSGLHSLSQSLYRLRKALVKTAFVTDTRTIAIGPSIDSDLSRLRAALSAGRWREGAVAFQGTLARDILAPDEPEFQHWLDRERSDVVASARRLMVQLERGHYWTDVEHVGRILAGADPFDREAVASVGRALMARGQAKAAQDWVATCNRVLSSELAAEVPTDTAMVSQSDGRGDDGAYAPFVGREDELRRLEDLWGSVEEDRPAVAVLRGEPGIGKTRLAHRFLKWAALRGGRSLLAAAYYHERHVAFGVAGQWLEDPLLCNAASELAPPWKDTLAKSFPGIFASGESHQFRPHGDDSPGELRLFEAIRRALTRVTDSDRLILFIDDAQWADPSTLAFLHFLARGRDLRALVLATERDGGSSHFLGWPDVVELQLGPLDLVRVKELIERQTASDSQRVNPTDLHLESGGNPLLVEALIQRREGSSGGQPPESIVAFFRPRLEALPETARRLVSALWVVGPEPQFRTAIRVAGIGDQEGERLVSELINGGILVGDAAAPRLRHTLAAEVAFASLSEADQRILNGRAARTLTESGLPEVKAVQFDVAGDRLNAYRNAMAAARASKELYATREAEYFLKLAIANSEGVHRAEAVMELVSQYDLNGRMREVAEIVEAHADDWEDTSLSTRAEGYRLLAQLANESRRERWVKDCTDFIDRGTKEREYGLVCRILAEVTATLCESGSIAEAITVNNRLMELSEHLRPQDEDIPFVVRAAVFYALTQSLEAGIAMMDGPLRRAKLVEHRAACLYARGSLRVARAELIEAEDDLLESLELSERFGLYGILQRSCNNLGVCYIEQGRFSEAESLLGQAVSVSRRAGELPDSQVHTDNLAILWFERGDYQRAVDMAGVALTSPDLSRRSRFSSLAIKGLASIELGHLAEATECERELRSIWKMIPLRLTDTSYAEWLLARIATLKGNSRYAIARLKEAGEFYENRERCCYYRLKYEELRVRAKTEPALVAPDVKALAEMLLSAGAMGFADRVSDLGRRLSRS